MPAVDPFSASSRPMIAFDSLPSRPLPFAAALHPRNLNTPPAAQSKLAVGEHNKSPTSGQVNDDARPGSGATRDMALESGQSSANGSVKVGGDEWMQMKVAECLDSARGTLDLNNCGLTSLSTKVEDLGSLVTLPQSLSPNPSSWSRHGSVADRSPSPLLDHEPNFTRGGDHFSASSGSFARTISAPVAKIPVVGLLPTDQMDMLPNAKDRKFGRSRTGAVVLGSLAKPVRGQREIELLLANNRLTSLPSVLFQLKNLTHLSLRTNNLTRLPAGIGQLENLAELNIGGNHLTYLPSTILHLRSLAKLWVYPNDFYKCPEPSDEELSPILAVTDVETYDKGSEAMHVTPGGRRLGPLIIRSPCSVPSLRAITMTKLISPRSPDDKPLLLDVDWKVEEKGESHPLLDLESFRSRLPFLPDPSLARILQTLKSSSTAGATRPIKYHTHHLSVSDLENRSDPFPQSHRTPPPDDASTNPYFSACPSDRHMILPENTAERFTRHLFLSPSEERIEWIDLLQEKGLPILWQGCKRRCLDFLEMEEDDDWTIDEDDEMSN